MANFTRRVLDAIFKSDGAGTDADPYVPHVVNDGDAAPAIGADFSAGDNSVASATGSSETIFAANTSAKERIIYNNGAASWFINIAGGTAADDASAVELAPGDSLILTSTNAVTGLGTTADTLAAFEGV